MTLLNYIHLIYLRAFRLNQYIHIHIFGGMILAKFAQSQGETVPFCLFFVFAVAVMWEAWEYYALSRRPNGVVNMYGSYRFWLFDSLGDVIGAVIAALIILI